MHPLITYERSNNGLCGLDAYLFLAFLRGGIHVVYKRAIKSAVVSYLPFQPRIPILPRESTPRTSNMCNGAHINCHMAVYDS